MLNEINNHHEHDDRNHVDEPDDDGIIIIDEYDLQSATARLFELVDRKRLLSTRDVQLAVTTATA